MGKKTLFVVATKEPVPIERAKVSIQRDAKGEPVLDADGRPVRTNLIGSDPVEVPNSRYYRKLLGVSLKEVPAPAAKPAKKGE